MRESKRTERMHLPKDSTETWLEKQVPAPRVGAHRTPSGDVYEAWMKKRVRGGRKAQKTTRKR